MTWRATFFLRGKNEESKEHFGFKSTKEPKWLPEMRKFEDKMLDLIQNIQFKENSRKLGDFQ